MLPYLKQPHVHLVIDPELVTYAGLRSGQDIGALDSSTIKSALETIEVLVEDERLPDKIVILHQFQDSKLTDKDKLDFELPRMDQVLSMDGFGEQAGKLG